MTTADRAWQLISDVLGTPAPVRLRLWNGSEAGPADAPVVIVRSRRALRQLIWSPGELGLARAYVTGDLDVEGDLAEGLRTVWTALATTERPGLRPAHVLRGLGLAARLGAIGPRPAPPAAEAQMSGELHSRERDREAISHHYDLSNEFYGLLLDDRMAYSCGFHTDPSVSLEQAQADKFDLVCRKLDLQPGQTLVDIGCGWGSLSLWAAEKYGVRIVGVTLSVEQREFVLKRAARDGLEDRVDVQVRHFRDLDVSEADAVASLEMGEHVGEAEYIEFANTVNRTLKPGGRALVQQMSRTGDHRGGGPFIETYIAPDMHMKPLHETVRLLSDPGLEVRDVQAMREHYPQTVAHWARRLEDRWDEAVALVGEETARVWRLYLAGGSLAFEQNRMGVDQILLVKPHADGRSDMPASPRAWLP